MQLDAQGSWLALNSASLEQRRLWFSNGFRRIGRWWVRCDFLVFLGLGRLGRGVAGDVLLTMPDCMELVVADCPDEILAYLIENHGQLFHLLREPFHDLSEFLNVGRFRSRCGLGLGRQRKPACHTLQAHGNSKMPPTSCRGRVSHRQHPFRRKGGSVHAASGHRVCRPSRAHGRNCSRRPRLPEFGGCGQVPRPASTTKM